MLEEIDRAVDPISESLSMSPSVGVAVAGGPMIQLPAEEQPHLALHRADSLRSGIVQAGPVALAGIIVNLASLVIVVLVARLVPSRTYGAINQLLSLFLILSMPGSALLVGVVRRVTAWERSGDRYRVHPWAGRVHRIALIGLAIEMVVVWGLQGWVAHELSLPNAAGVFWILTAAGIWILLCFDRGLMQARRDYRSLAWNLVIEGGVRTVVVVGLVAAGFGVGGYAAGLFLCEAVAWVHARWVAARDWPALSAPPGAVTEPAAVRRARRTLVADVSAAFVGLGLLALLQNVDVIIVGRMNPGGSGSYAAISVASKALVFGAVALGSYLLPEATIRWNEGGHALRQLGVTLLLLAVPATVLFGVAALIPHWFISLFFSSKLSTAAPAFVWLVASMAFLCVSVLLTNYLFGAGRRWIVGLIGIAAALAVALIAAAGGRPLASARADLLAQGALAVMLLVAFSVIHHRERRARLPWPVRR